MDGPLTNEDVLGRHIPWESYKVTGQISERDFALIKRLDKSSETAKASALEENSPAMFEALLGLLRSVTNETTVQYTLALLDELTMMNPEQAGDMHVPSRSHPTSGPPNAPLTLSRLLTRSDWFTQSRAAKLLALALQTADKQDPEIVAAFLNWLTGQLRHPSAGDDSILVATGALAGLLRSREVRTQYALNVPILEGVLKGAVRSTSAARSQMLYNTGLCLWQLSFDEAGTHALLSSGAVEPLVDLLKQGNKEKVMRIALLTLSRLLATGDAAAEGAMLDAGLPRIVRIRSAQSFADEDIPDLLEKLDEALGDRVSELSSFEKYKAEVVAGALDWGPMHTSVQFWQENASAMEQKDFQLLRALIKLAATSADAKVLAVAANDIGMFAEAHPHGRYIVADLKGKEPVMRLMQHSDGDVQKHALLCVQRLMLARDKLDFLKRPAADGVADAPAAASVSA